MTVRFINSTVEKFYFKNDKGKRKSYKLIFGDEVATSTIAAPSGDCLASVRFRGRLGEIKKPELISSRSLEMYFLDVGQGDAAFVDIPNNTKIMIDGGL